jgi:hypothetical protein
MDVRFTVVPLADVRQSMNRRDKRLVVGGMDVPWDSIVHTFRYLWDYVEEKIVSDDTPQSTPQYLYSLHVVHCEFHSTRFVIGACLSYFDIATQWVWIPAIATRGKDPYHRDNGISFEYTTSRQEKRLYQTDQPPHGWSFYDAGKYRSNNLMTSVLAFHDANAKGIKLCSIQGQAARYSEFGFVFDLAGETAGTHRKGGSVRLHRGVDTDVCMDTDLDDECVIMRWDATHRPGGRTVDRTRMRLESATIPVRRSPLCGARLLHKKLPRPRVLTRKDIEYIDVDADGFDFGFDPVRRYDRRGPVRHVRRAASERVCPYHIHGTPRHVAPSRDASHSGDGQARRVSLYGHGPYATPLLCDTEVEFLNLDWR